MVKIRILPRIQEEREKNVSKVKVFFVRRKNFDFRDSLPYNGHEKE